MIEPSKFLCISPENIEIAIADDRTVVIRLRGLEKEAGLTPGLGVMIALTPTEAKRLSSSLLNTANKAEEGLPRS